MGKLLYRLATVPSGGLGHPPRRVRLLALLACRDEMGYLPGYVANVAPQVDGIVAVDDGSSDGSAEYLASRPEVLEVIRIPPDRPHWDEPGNHLRLVAAALRHRGDWAVVLDADERVEREFRSRAERVIGRGRWLGLSAYGVRVHELWDSLQQYRADGVWGHKAPHRLFRLRPGDRFDDAALHASKAPLDARVRGRVLWADLRIYHLRMVEPAERERRRERYERVDPCGRWQPAEGYGYLTDETGLELRSVPSRRGFAE